VGGLVRVRNAPIAILSGMVLMTLAGPCVAFRP
jgi:hypothetical protein